MSRRCLPRFAASIVVLAAIVALALGACAPLPMVAAPIGPPQSPYGYSPGAPPPGPPTAPNAGAPVASGPAKVGLLVPLTGPNAELGKAIQQAAQLALFEGGGAELTLVPRDTGGTAEGAAAAARSLVGQGVQLILGPLLAGEVEAVKPIARAANVNVIAFSTATQLANDHTYLMGFLPRQEIVRVVGYASERGVKRFAALAPATAYGRLMAETLRREAAAVGANVTQVELYDPRGDVAGAVRRLLPPAGGATGGAPATDTAIGGPPALLPPGVRAPAAAPPSPTGPPGPANFDALLLPEGGARLKDVARQLRTAGLDTTQVRLLGSGLWDDPSIASEPALVGGWFAASPPAARNDFVSRYQKAYGAAPPRLASLGFDAAALAAVLARGEGGSAFSSQAIQNPSGFTGVDGLFRFTPDGLVQRGLAVLEVQPQGDVVVSPAPQTFQSLGY